MKKQTKLYFIRHGEVHNPRQIVYGRLPGFGLSETGKKEAEAIGRRLKHSAVRVIYASPLTRAVETASHIAKYFPKVKIRKDERLLEIRSPVDGTPNTVMYAREWNFYTPDLLKTGGESLPEIWDRMESFIRDALEKHEGEEIIAVSHGDPIMVVRAKFSGNRRLTLSAIRADYITHASGFVLTFEAGQCKGIRSISQGG